jgi:hypothetical protein
MGGPERGSAMLRVDYDGAFNAQHLAPGRYAVLVMLPGYRMPFDDIIVHQDDNQITPEVQKGIEAAGGSVVIQANEAESITISLDRAAALSGRVIFPDGTPAAQVRISVDPIPKQAGPESQVVWDKGFFAMRMLTGQRSSTDDRGRFHVSGLLPGTYTVSAFPPTLDQTAVGIDESEGLRSKTTWPAEVFASSPATPRIRPKPIISSWLPARRSMISKSP